MHFQYIEALKLNSNKINGNGVISHQMCKWLNTLNL